MKRVVILGRGASGKSTLAARLGEFTALPVIELDKIFWQPGLVATPRDEWVKIQEKLAAQEKWIMDGDLGAYDALEPRLRAADTILLLDFSLPRCALRAIRRSRTRRLLALANNLPHEKPPHPVTSHRRSRPARNSPHLSQSHPDQQIPHTTSGRSTVQGEQSRA